MRFKTNSLIRVLLKLPFQEVFPSRNLPGLGGFEIFHIVSKNIKKG